MQYRILLFIITAMLAGSGYPINADETPLAFETPHPTPDLGDYVNIALPILVPVEYPDDVADIYRDGYDVTIDLKDGWKPPAYMVGGVPYPLMLQIINGGTKPVALKVGTNELGYIHWLCDDQPDVRSHMLNYDLSTAIEVVPPKSIYEATFYLVPPVIPDGYITYTLYLGKGPNRVSGPLSPIYEYRSYIRNPLNADFLDNTIPDQMKPGESREVQITVRNDGYNIWDRDPFEYYLDNLNEDAEQFVRFNYGKGDVRIDVPIGEKYTWTFEIQAPKEEGIYYPQWKMYYDYHSYKNDKHEKLEFGEILTKSIEIKE